MESEKNLKDAFSGESQAHMRYLAFAKKAKEEGFSNVAKLFEAIASAEVIHAFKHLKNLDDVKSTKENISYSIDGENYESTSMYPSFVEKAEEEGLVKVAEDLKEISAVEKIHELLFKEALKAVEEGRDFELRGKIWVCQHCGNVHIGEEPLETCPICGHKNEFKAVE